jgi:hypothetical protein
MEVTVRRTARLAPGRVLDRVIPDRRVTRAVCLQTL